VNAAYGPTPTEEASLLRQRYLNAFQYHFALRQAHTACEFAPEDGRYQTALGIAQYRTGQYQEALTTLKQLDQRGIHTPEALAFLAMAQHQLGQKEQAKATLARLRETVTKPRWAKNAESAAFLREAEALIEGKAPDPKQ
jgi:Flp pilus assembly protein TadD